MLKRVSKSGVSIIQRLIKKEEIINCTIVGIDGKKIKRERRRVILSKNDFIRGD